MIEEYLTNKEYEGYLGRLGGIRGRILEELQIEKGMTILDIGCGYGYFTVEVAKKFPGVSIVGIDIAKEDVERAKELFLTAGSHPDESGQDPADRKKEDWIPAFAGMTGSVAEGAEKKINFFQMDAAKMGFRRGCSMGW
jgi:SAM-dependent methyltransferase